MNGKKAKKIRKLIYGDHSHKQKEYKRDLNGAINCVGLRHDYKEAKKLTSRCSGAKKLAR